MRTSSRNQTWVAVSTSVLFVNTTKLLAPTRITTSISTLTLTEWIKIIWGQLQSQSRAEPQSYTYIPQDQRQFKTICQPKLSLWQVFFLGLNYYKNYIITLSFHFKIHCDMAVKIGQFIPTKIDLMSSKNPSNFRDEPH